MHQQPVIVQRGVGVKRRKKYGSLQIFLSIFIFLMFISWIWMISTLSSWTNTTTKTTLFPLDFFMESPTTRQQHHEQQQPRVAISIVVTSCQDPNDISGGNALLQGAAVLSKLIRNQQQKSSSYSKPDFIAIVNDNTTAVSSFCTVLLERMGYIVMRKSVPVQIQHRPAGYLYHLRTYGCCAEVEFLKLWAYSLEDEYDAIIQLDIDTYVLKPLDDLFNVLIYPSNDIRHLTSRGRLRMMRSSSSSELSDNNNTPPKNNKNNSISALFTRDYTQISMQSYFPPEHPWQVPIQGGFLAIRPSLATFHELVRVAETTPYSTEQQENDTGSAWNSTMTIRYWGMPQMQGLLAYYYGYVVRENYSFLELHDCFINTLLSDHQYNHSGQMECTTKEDESLCSDCRMTNVDNDVIIAHPMSCFKPWECYGPWSNQHLIQLKATVVPIDDDDIGKIAVTKQCRTLLSIWTKTRRLVEEEWSNGNKIWNHTNTSIEFLKQNNKKRKRRRQQNITHYLPDVYNGYCIRQGLHGNVPMKFERDSLSSLV